MKLELENAKNPFYQKVLVYDSRGVPKPENILELVFLTEDKRKLTLKQIFEELFSENKKLKEKINDLETKLNENTKQSQEDNKLQVELIEALRKETREKGIL